MTPSVERITGRPVGGSEVLPCSVFTAVDWLTISAPAIFSRFTVGGWGRAVSFGRVKMMLLLRMMLLV